MATQYAHGKIITDGLVLCLDAADPNSYPGSGITWYDVAGTNNGTLTNGPTYSNGSIVFDGVDDYVNCGDPLITTGDSFTFSTWFKAGNQTTSAGSILRPFIIQTGTNAATVTEVSMVRDGSIDHGKVRFRVGDGTTITSTLTYNDDNWHQAVAISNGTTTFLYVDNTFINTATPGNIPNPLGVYIAGDPDLNDSRWLVGSIASAKIYNRALSADEVAQNYNATKGRFGL